MHLDRSQDSAATSREALLEHAEFVRELATALVRDPNEADDLVQETWLAAFGREWGVGDGLRGRLFGLVRGLASNRRRADARRRYRELESARSEAVAPDAELVERIELRQSVVSAILALDEPYRVVLLLRYEDGLAPPEIAGRLQLPIETVRTRLRRGLARVRSRLDVEHGERQAWAPALLALSHGSPSAPVVALTTLAMKKALFSSLAVLLLALTSWFALDALREGVPVGDSNPALSALNNLPESVGDTQHDAEQDLSQAARGSVRSRMAAVEESTHLSFTILASEGARPLPGAVVYCASAEMLTGELRSAHNGDLELQLHEVGERFVADTAGVVRLPSSVRGGWICARQGPLWGGRRVSADESAPYALELMEDRGLLVRVLDHRGVVLSDVPLALYGSMEGRSSSLWSGVSVDPDLGVTIAHIDHVVGKWIDGGGARWLLRADIPTSPRPEVEVDLGPIDSQVVELQLPPVGQLLVRVRMEGYASDSLAGHYWVKTEGPQGGATNAKHLGASVHAMFESGAFLLDNVGIGERCTLSVSGWTAPDLTTFDGAIGFVGPDEHGLTREVELVGQPKGLRATGRLLDESGEPIRSGSARFLVTKLEASTFSPMVREFRTDEGGAFELSWSSALPQEGWRLHMLVEDGDGAQFMGEFRFDSQLAEFGDLRLADAPLLAAGRVVDELGSPVARATVGVAHGPIRLDGLPSNPDSLRSIAYYRTRLVLFDGTTDSDGNFRLFGRPGHDDLSLGAAGAETVAGSLVSFESGAQDLELLAVHTGGLSGRITFPRGTRAAEMWVTLAEGKRISRLGLGLRNPFRMVRPEASGRFRLESIPFERVTLRVHLGDTSEPLIEVKNLKVVRGEVSSDPRLSPLDLSQLGHRLELRAYDADSNSIESATVEFRPSAHPDAAHIKRTLRNGKLEVVLPWQRVDVVITAKGYREIGLQGIEGYREVVLEEE